ncbi:MAG TPA: DUF72 domain-containing protein, partial [Candidatus Krumholzibacteria bacterium]|nr:DUF72 domain-containing protein [Candidatus Krumholzibacteria bacterium]
CKEGLILPIRSFLRYPGNDMATPSPLDLVRFGCSSFSSKDWVGPFYPPKTPPGEFLSIYSRHFDTVEIDASYYAVPERRTVQGWDEKTPEGFLVCAKFPRSIVHAGKGAQPDTSRLLSAEYCYRDRDAFLANMALLGDKLGPLLLQFPYFNRQTFARRGDFFERLEHFLGDLPREFRYAVEIRNKNWLVGDFVSLLREHEVSLTVVDQAWMPHGDELEGKLDLVPAQPLYLRLLGDRQRIEAITKSWEKEVIDQSERLDRWVTFLVRRVKDGVPVLVFVNNHYAGHAPATVVRLRQLFEAALGRVGG